MMTAGSIDFPSVILLPIGYRSDYLPGWIGSILDSLLNSVICDRKTGQRLLHNWIVQVKLSLDTKGNVEVGLTPSNVRLSIEPIGALHERRVAPQISLAVLQVDSRVRWKTLQGEEEHLH